MSGIYERAHIIIIRGGSLLRKTWKFTMNRVHSEIHNNWGGALFLHGAQNTMTGIHSGCLNLYFFKSLEKVSGKTASGSFIEVWGGGFLLSQNYEL